MCEWELGCGEWRWVRFDMVVMKMGMLYRLSCGMEVVALSLNRTCIEALLTLCEAPQRKKIVHPT